MATTPYFAEGTEAMIALEAMVDRVGVANVLYALQHICNAKPITYSLTGKTGELHESGAKTAILAAARQHEFK
jgi:hypothetical protein